MYTPMQRKYAARAAHGVRARYSPRVPMDAGSQDFDSLPAGNVRRKVHEKSQGGGCYRHPGFKVVVRLAAHLFKLLRGKYG